MPSQSAAGDVPGQPGRVTLTAPSGVAAVVSTRGATLCSLAAPDRDGVIADIVRGFGRDEDHVRQAGFYAGSVIGRVANRIRDARFDLDGTPYSLVANEGRNQLHGGSAAGFDRALWEVLDGPAAREGASLRLRHVSPHLDGGYPGTVDVIVTYTLTMDDELRVDFEATTSEPTPLNLTHHPYWNLAGPASDSVMGHELRIWADRYTPTDGDLIPTGAIAPVEGTALDFRVPAQIGARRSELEAAGRTGYDHNLVLGPSPAPDGVAVRLRDPGSGRILEIVTDRPCLQFYTATTTPATAGRAEARHERWPALCLEPQGYPDAVNQPGFPSIVVRPGAPYRAWMVYRLRTDRPG